MRPRIECWRSGEISERLRKAAIAARAFKARTLCVFLLFGCSGADESGAVDMSSPADHVGSETGGDSQTINPGDALEIIASPPSDGDVAADFTAQNDIAEVLPPESEQPRDLSEVHPGVTAHDVAFAYAPIWYQDTAGKGPDDLGAKGDVPTLIDYDQDRVHKNNWDNLVHYPVSPWLYYSVVATETHYFLAYAHYQPRDWEQICTGLLTECHEGDMGTAYVVVRRAEGGFGTVEAVRTHAHGENSYWYVGEASGLVANQGDILGGVDFEDEQGGISPVPSPEFTRVRLFSQSKGHGVAPCTATEKESQPFGVGNVSCPDGEGRAFPGGDGIKYVPSNDTIKDYSPGDPAAGETLDYGLVSIPHTLWVWRSEIHADELFSEDGAFRYLGSRGVPYHTLEDLGFQYAAEQFFNDSVSGKPPWSEDTAGAKRGDALLDPAFAFSSALSFPSPFSMDYDYHPYLPVEAP